MSVFFANINVRTGDQVAVASAFKRLPRRESAFVAPAVNGWVTLFEQVSDEANDEDRLSGYTVMLSDALKTTAIGIMVYDSDVLLYTLAQNGTLVDQFSSWPDYFDENMPDEERRRWEGRPKELARLTNADPRMIRTIMDGEHDFAEEKLAELAPVLGLPPHAARWGYSYLADAEEDEDAERPEQASDYIHVPAAFGMLG